MSPINIDFEKIMSDKINECSSDNLHLYFGKKRIEDNQPTYNFYKSSTGSDVRDKLLNILTNNLRYLKNDNIVDTTDVEDGNHYFNFNLDGIDAWKKFEHCVYNDIHKFKEIDENEFKKYKKPIRRIKDVKKLKNNLNHYLLIVEEDEFIFGQISRIYPKQVMADKSKMRMNFIEKKFTEITTKPGVEFDDHDSVLFYIDKNHKFGFTNNIKEYIEIFDMDTQYKTNAINLIRNSEFSQHCDIDAAIRIVENDRTLQRMLNRDMTVYAFDNFNIDNITESFDRFSEFDVLKDFNVVFEDNKFVIDEKNERDSLRNIVKFVGRYFNPSLDGQFLIEGNPKHIINQLKTQEDGSE